MSAAAVPLRRGSLETITIVLLLIGGFLGGIGWFAGVILLWLSQIWSTRDKLIGTLVVPGGLTLPIFLFALGSADLGRETSSCTGIVGGATTCTTSGGRPLWETTLFVVILITTVAAAIASAVHLARTSVRPA